MESKDELKRQCRKVSEKRRRDEFNALIAEIAAVLPLSGSRADKASVLQETITFLLTHRSNIGEDSKGYPSFIPEQPSCSTLNFKDLIHLLLEGLAGFLVTFTSTFQVLFVSPNYPHYLRDTPLLVGSSLLDIISPADYSALGTIFTEGSSVPSPLLVHMLCGSSFIPLLLNYTRLVNTSPEMGPVALALCHLTSPLPLPAELPWIPDDTSGFATRLSPDFKLLELDATAALILGSNLIGTSLYERCHPEDLTILAEGHKMLCRTGRGHSFPYRVCTCRQVQFRIVSQFYLSYDPWSAIPQYVSATHHFV